MECFWKENIKQTGLKSTCMAVVQSQSSDGLVHGAICVIWQIGAWCMPGDFRGTGIDTTKNKSIIENKLIKKNQIIW